MKIQTELTIDPAQGIQSARYTLAVGSEVVFQKYEHDLSATEREFVSLIAWGNRRQMERIAERLKAPQ